MLAGLILGPRNGALAVVLFLFVVALGAPVLSGGRGGLGVFFGPTLGFLLGWVAGALACGFLAGWFQRLMPTQRFSSALVACLLGGIVVIYAFGVPVLAWRTDMTLTQALLAAMVFVPGDVLKSFLAAWVAVRIPRSVMERQ
jgi:biotin transport system substrate-specific component